ncbi:PAS domain S-box protein [uncultured Desulfosarcina sp.]|uniref:PAS domain-containing sensor histidine kinase n=1 Tax=uncultured Desulfosarcina sp. TaxID=218289 RepID=UPI0029C9AD79|nr:PAS domain S-box protein [uncultured Desulfosarcina sp.]
MTDPSGTNKKLIEENAFLKMKLQELEQGESERKQMKEALRESEENYQTLIQKIQTAVVVHGPNTRILTCNPIAQELLGLTEAQLLGKTAIDKDWHFFNADGTVMDVEEYPVNQVIATRQPLGNLVAGVHRPNKGLENDVWVLINANPVIVNGQIVQVIVTFVDITERKRAEEALRESERKYRNLYHYAHVGLFETGMLDAKIIACNQRYCDLAGFPTVDSAIGMDTIHLYTNPSDREELKKLLREQGYIADHVLQLKNRLTGETFWAEFSARTNPSSDVIEGTIIDISERKQAEEERLRLQERLSRAEKMESLGILAGGVAHDLNNILGIVLGYAELLLLKENKMSAIRAELEAIMKGGKKAAAIVDDLLTLARRGVPGREVLNLNKVVSDFKQSPEFTKLSFNHPLVKIKTDLEPDLLNVSGSSLHLSKSVYNLVSNASEAMPKGGLVTIKTTNQYLDMPIHGYDKISEGDYVVLSVSDEGEGIHATDIKRIFEPFYTKKIMGRSGTGLGLAVVWGTVKDHDGYINVQSKEGKGSTFKIYLPVAREELSAEHVAVAISEYMGKGESILVVDDVKGQRRIATLILEKLNTVLYEAPVVRKYSEMGSTSHGISGQDIRGVFSTC